MSDFQRPERKKIALDNRKLGLIGLIGPGMKPSSLGWGLYSNNPRIIVYTNDPGDTVDYGKIAAHLDTPTFYAFIDAIRLAADDKLPDGKVVFQNKNFIYPKGQRSETPVIQSQLVVGRDEDGAIWISVLAKERPKIKFYFITPEFHTLLNGKGEPLGKGLVSQMYARAYASMLEQMYGHLSVTEYVEPVKKPQQGQGGAGQGGGNRGGYGGQQSGGGGVSGGDDDIPF
jgi:hypothetical protein